MPLHQIINNCLIFYYTFIAQKEANCSLYQAILHLYYCCSQVNSFLQCFLLSLAKLVSQKFCCCTRQLFGNLRLIGFFIVNTRLPRYHHHALLLLLPALHSQLYRPLPQVSGYRLFYCTIHFFSYP